MIRSRARALRGLLAVVLVVVVLPVQARPAAAVDGRAPRSERELLRFANTARARAGLPRLRLDPAMSEVARRRSAEMLTANTLSHAPNLVQQVSLVNWQRVGENVGFGTSAREIHARLLASAPHRANLLGRFNVIGIGAVRDRRNRVWVTQVFVELPSG